jgi:hypothetical protein
MKLSGGPFDGATLTIPSGAAPMPSRLEIIVEDGKHSGDIIASYDVGIHRILEGETWRATFATLDFRTRTRETVTA